MLTIQGLVCGTPEYMAPEQARAEPLDGRADLYAAAVILYQMVTGDIPFRADSPMAIVSRHLVEAPVPPSKRRPDLRLPKIIDDVVLRGLEKEREMRYPTAVAFREVLEGVLGATSGPATPVAAQRPRRAADGARHLGARSDRAGRHRDDPGAVAVANDSAPPPT